MHVVHTFCLGIQHCLLERGASTFPLVNLTRVSLASFSWFISTLGGFGGPERTEILCSPIMTYVVVGTLTSAGSDTLVVAPGSSSSSSGLLRVNSTLVDFPPG